MTRPRRFAAWVIPRSIRPIPPVPFGTILHRVAQGLDALWIDRPGDHGGDGDGDGDRDNAAMALLTPSQRVAFAALSAFDRRHAIRVWGRVSREVPADHDLAVAALLHDLAKAGSPGLPGRVHLPDRVTRVLLRRLAPGLLARLATPLPPVPRWRTGLVLAVHHPSLGAAWAADIGCSPRVCWLIAHHHDRTPVKDPVLRALMAADEAG
ncbi:MAG: hypothetical protein WKF80_08925 [Thermomicrobiales bacterium]